jgi:signal transduction histidine kinase
VRAEVDLEAVLVNTLSFLAEKFQRRGIAVETSFEEVPAVKGDSERLQQLFLNLFLNATDAMPKGGELRIALAPRDADVEVHVADSGAGISPAELSRVFDPFFTTKPAGEGSGLGLAVVQGIVSEHGGSIEAESVEGEGTEFIIVLPGEPSSTRNGDAAEDSGPA